MGFLLLSGGLRCFLRTLLFCFTRTLCCGSTLLFGLSKQGLFLS